MKLLARLKIRMDSSNPLCMFLLSPNTVVFFHYSSMSFLIVLFRINALDRITQPKAIVCMPNVLHYEISFL